MVDAITLLLALPYNPLNFKHFFARPALKQNKPNDPSRFQLTDEVLTPSLPAPSPWHECRFVLTAT